MKILIADKFPDSYIDELKKSGLDVNNSPKLGESDLQEAAKGYEVLVVRSTKVNANSLSSIKFNRRPSSNRT
jgi:D-3-phosphoglycerate dehydrogenase